MDCFQGAHGSPTTGDNCLYEESVMLRREKLFLFAVVSLAALCLSAVPARAAMYDLSARPMGPVTINGAWFYNVETQSTGTGVMDSFIKIQSNVDVEQGYNSDGRPVTYDEKNTPNHSLPLTDVPIVSLPGKGMFREFLLDLDEPLAQGQGLISLDTVQIFLASVGNLTGPVAGLGTPIYNMDIPTPDNYIRLNAGLGHGSGSGDMFAYIPDALFTGGSFVYLYSKFGESERPAYAANNNPEEWGVREVSTVVPLPGAVLLGMLGLGAAGLKLRQFA